MHTAVNFTELHEERDRGGGSTRGLSSVEEYDRLVPNSLALQQDNMKKVLRRDGLTFPTLGQT